MPDLIILQPTTTDSPAPPLRFTARAGGEPVPERPIFVWPQADREMRIAAPSFHFPAG
jgi:hypothetical protein